ncbi:uncharacterized protein LOC130331362 isoform X2 [Hyla sarda]|uniref:uncharacterized protein LOC130331362 isoform X2 n=1 Tax=Hyla sarda TaxID=327740 RepID=UPI0024C30F29|nr:uncharacterized protein LOC130331362 isoform X2 [Hyla sarda]
MTLEPWQTEEDFRGQDTGGHTDVFSSPGSDVLLPLRYNLTIDKDNKKCDQFIWRYNSFQISRQRTDCYLNVYNYTGFSNYKIWEGGNLTLRNITRNNSGNYTVIVRKGGDEVFTHNYNLHVQDPVSVPLLYVSCLPDGGSNISCRIITGSDPSVSITVNGDLLVNSPSSRTTGDVNEVSVLVDSPGPWDITCSVRNRVSDNETRKTGENCPVPPSVPVLVGWCLHDGRQEVSCSVEYGSDLIFSLSGNRTLLENVRKYHKRVNVTLPSSGSWDVHCSVRNNLGMKNKTETFQACPVPPSHPVLKVSCLQDGGSELSCSVEKGTGLVFSLTVNGESLKNVTKQEKSINVILSSSGPWDIHCSVTNNLGKENKTETLECSVPVSVPILNVSCHHDGSVRGFCSVEVGTDVSYTWTVNGEIITWNTDPNLTINSSEFTSGAINFSCSVENSISRGQSNVTNIDCGDPCSPCLRNSIIGGSVALIVTIIALCIASYYMDHNRRED